MRERLRLSQAIEALGFLKKKKKTVESFFYSITHGADLDCMLFFCEVSWFLSRFSLFLVETLLRMSPDVS